MVRRSSCIVLTTCTISSQLLKRTFVINARIGPLASPTRTTSSHLILMLLYVGWIHVVGLDRLGNLFDILMRGLCQVVGLAKLDKYLGLQVICRQRLQAIVPGLTCHLVLVYHINRVVLVQAKRVVI